MRREGKPGSFIPSEVPAYTRPAQVTTPAPVRRHRRATRAVGARAKRPRSGDDVYAREETLVLARERMRVGDNACVWATTSAPVRQRVARGRGVFSQTQRSCDGVCVRSTTPASGRRSTRAPGRQRLRPCDDGCRAGGVFFHQHSKLQRSGDDVCIRRQRLRPGDNACVQVTTSACARATTRAPGRQRLRPCDDGCRVGGVFFHKHPKLQRSGDDVCVRATTVAHGRRRLDPIVLMLAFFFLLWQSKQNFSIISFRELLKLC